MPKSEHMTPLTSVDGSLRRVANLQALSGCASASGDMFLSQYAARKSPTVH